MINVTHIERFANHDGPGIRTAFLITPLEKRNMRK